MILDWLKRRKKVTGTGELEKHHLNFLDHETGKEFKTPYLTKPRKPIDVHLFSKIQRALVLKKARRFYRTEAQIAKKFNIGATTVSLIRRATEKKRTLKTQYEHYKELRKKHSKPERYDDNEE